MYSSYSIQLDQNFFFNKEGIMENEEKRTNEGRRALERRERFNPNYKGWQRRNMPNQRSQKEKRKSKEETTSNQ